MADDIFIGMAPLDVVSGRLRRRSNRFADCSKRSPDEPTDRRKALSRTAQPSQFARQVFAGLPVICRGKDGIGEDHRPGGVGSNQLIVVHRDSYMAEATEMVDVPVMPGPATIKGDPWPPFNTSLHPPA